MNLGLGSGLHGQTGLLHVVLGGHRRVVPSMDRLDYSMLCLGDIVELLYLIPVVFT